MKKGSNAFSALEKALPPLQMAGVAITHYTLSPSSPKGSCLGRRREILAKLHIYNSATLESCQARRAGARALTDCQGGAILKLLAYCAFLHA